MKNFKTLLSIIFIAIGLFLTSCDNDDANKVFEENNFYALTVGNYWEYKYYLKDVATNSFVATTTTETVEITHAVVENGNTYYNFKHIISGNNGGGLLVSNGEQNYKLRDSLGYLIDQRGGIKYVNNNYEEHFVDLLSSTVSYYLKLSSAEEVATEVNAGSFSCLDIQFFAKEDNGNQLNGIAHTYRADDKGEILSTITHVSQSEHFSEKRLEAYSIQ